MSSTALGRTPDAAVLHPVAAMGRDLEFDQLFLAEYGRVRGVAARILGDWAAAEDVAQECFLRLHQRHPHGIPHAAAWLHRGAVRAALNRVRAERRRAVRESRRGAPPAREDPKPAALRRETREEVRAALRRLPRRAAAALALRHGGLSYQEVADALGVRPNQVGTLLRRAERALLREVERNARA